MRFRRILRTIIVIIKNSILGINIISLSLLRYPRNMMGYISECLFLFQTYSKNKIIPQKNVFQVLPGNDLAMVQLGNLTGKETWFNGIPSYSCDIISLCLICQAIKAKVVFEIGTMRGYTAFHFALNTGDDALIYTLDLPRAQNTGASKLETTIMDEANIRASLGVRQYHFEDADVKNKITCLFGDSAEFDFSPFRGKVDFFFIDGAHSYDYVKSDTFNALECCHPGSVIAWHDYGRSGVNGVTKWLHEFAKENKIYSIPGGSVAFMVVE